MAGQSELSKIQKVIPRYPLWFVHDPLPHPPPKIRSTIPSTARAPQLHFRPIDNLVLLLLVPGANTLLGDPEDMVHGMHSPCQPTTLFCLLVHKDFCDAKLQTQLESIISNQQVDLSPMVEVAYNRLIKPSSNYLRSLEVKHLGVSISLHFFTVSAGK